MATHTRRVQTVLTPEQYENLVQIAQQAGKPLSILVREAVEKVYFEDVERQRREAALRELLSLNAPVADWDQMEEEIIRGALQ
jgi:predicted DNA-binding protein